MFGGSTPLFIAAENGHIAAIQLLLRAKANPLLTMADKSGQVVVPFFAHCGPNGHLQAVRELVHQCGIEGCGGKSGGLQALRTAASTQHVGIMTVRMDAGVVDDGEALTAELYGQEASVKYLLRRKTGAEAAHVNSRDNLGITPLLHAMGFGGFNCACPRIVRLLADAGPDIASDVRVTNSRG